MERLCAKDSPQLKTIQLQVNFEEEYHRQLDAIERASLPVDPLSTGGRGLFLIREMSDSIGMDDGVLEVWVRPR